MSIETTRLILSLIAIISVISNCVVLLHWIDVKYDVRDDNKKQVPNHISISSILGCVEITLSTIFFGAVVCIEDVSDNIRKPTEIAIFLFLMGIYLVITAIVFTKNKKE